MSINLLQNVVHEKTQNSCHACLTGREGGTEKCNWSSLFFDRQGVRKRKDLQNRLRKKIFRTSVAKFNSDK
jgi:hypothetical protein